MLPITLTTDLGQRDFYLAALKGRMISLLPDVRLVDVTHDIPPFDVQAAAVALRNAYRYFPEGTVHLIGVDSVFREGGRHAIMKFGGHFFVGGDNGIFSIILGENEAQELFEINIPQDPDYLHFPLADTLAKAACHIAKGGVPSEIGRPMDEPLRRMMVQPLSDADSIKGHIAHIDSFGNAISDISRELFEKVQNERPFRLHFKHNETIDQLSRSYSEVPEGERLCLFGISNFLEIAINKGHAARLLGLQRDEIVIVEFFD